MKSKVFIFLVALALQITIVCSANADKAIYNPFPDKELICDYCPTIIQDLKKFSGHGTPCSYKMWHEGPHSIAVSTSEDGILQLSAVPHATFCSCKACHGR